MTAKASEAVKPGQKPRISIVSSASVRYGSDPDPVGSVIPDADPLKQIFLDPDPLSSRKWIQPITSRNRFN
uniref:Uncharacterized protein n=1 Tax=Romanomermis culicivorax TaxID=13658 RepID=A0A915HJX7_ROMCU